MLVVLNRQNVKEIKSVAMDIIKQCEVVKVAYSASSSEYQKLCDLKDKYFTGK